MLFASSVAVLIALGTVSSAGAAKQPAPVPGGGLENFTPAMTPLGMSSKPTTVVVQLAGSPIIAQDADSRAAGNGPLSSGQKEQIRQQLKSAQAPVEQQISQTGGKVIADYQAAYNGIKVLIPANKTADLKALSGVVAVHPMIPMKLANIHGVPQIGAPAVWDGLTGFHGEGIKIADLDTGLDYTHADFGGPGTALAYQQALAVDTADPTLPTTCITAALTPCFGPSAPKVKGGTDLVGDNYDASSADPARNTPVPDPNPLDCNSHGTHTAGTLAGFGVLSNGSTYTGVYNASTIDAHAWNVGPGVAPKADLYSVRIFGCNGSTNETIDGIEWAVDHNMDVINMSLGSPFGSPTDPDAVAATNAAKDGIIVISASGNEGPAPYMTSTPGAGTGGLAVAAEDPTQSFPGATLTLSPGGSLTAIDANGAAIPSGSFPVKVIAATTNDASLGGTDTISLGCSVADDQAGGSVAGKFIVVERGGCARVAKAMFGQMAGAAGVIMINSSGGLPPFEGPITNDPDAPGPPLFGGFSLTVTIPFLGVAGSTQPSTSAAGVALLAATSLTATATTLTNPGFSAVANFSSGGPDGSNSLKPQVTAPGVSIASAGMGTGNGPQIDSGTSMATPHTAGMAALVKQAHPTWNSVQAWTAAIENTADPGGIAGYSTIAAGAGLIQALPATRTQVVAYGGSGRDATGDLNFGLQTLDRDLSQNGRVTLHNYGSQSATFNVSDQLDQGSPHSLGIDQSQVTVPAHGDATVNVTLNVPAATAGPALDPNTFSYLFNDVTGLVTFAPASGGDNNGVTLRVPYLLVPQAISHVRISHVNLGHLLQGSVGVTLSNDHAAATGIDDWFAWGLKDRRTAGLTSDDLLAGGVQSFPSQGVGIFALQTAHRWTNPAENEFDVLVDVNGDGNPDYDVVAVDFGAFTTGNFNGEDAVAVISEVTGHASIDFLTGADFNGTTMELPFLFSQLCQPSTPCLSSTPISYTMVSFGLTDGTSDQFAASSTFDLNHPAVSSANFEDAVPAGGTATDTVSVDKAQFKTTPQLGVLVLSQNNLDHNNREEALTIPLSLAAHRP